MTSILDGLNDKQKEAVQIIEGPVLVLSGPGSGKTRVLTHRIAYLIEKGIKPENILAVTFTNKAADEMRQRIVKLLNCSIDELPSVGTFHSICAQILRREAEAAGIKPSFIIYDESDQLSLVKKTLKELQIDPKQFSPQKMREAISSLKNELISPEAHTAAAEDFFPKILSKIYVLYQKKLKENNALDFDDLIMKAVELFQKNDAATRKYQNKFQYILVDEYQDINSSQFALLKLLAQAHGNIFVIGDESQNIYSFRGADFRNILNFERDWPKAKVLILEENYRSTQNILDAAYNLISKSPNFKNKNLVAKKAGGEPLILKEVENEEEEGAFVVSRIKKLKAENPHLYFNDFVVLYRTNAQSRAVEEEFIRANVPYKIIGGVKFYQRKEVKDILAWLRVIQNKNDSVSMERILKFSKVSNFPTFVKTSADRQFPISNDPEQIPSKFNGASKNSKSEKRLQAINYLLDDFLKKSEECNLTGLINYILEKTGHEDYLRDGSEEGERRWENVEELFSIAQKFDSLESPLGLQRFLEEVSLLTNQDEIEDRKRVVNLMTFHAAKGLEFQVVFILGCEEGIFPHHKSLLAGRGKELDEERRLCYVAITRAKEKVYLVFARQRKIFGTTQVNPPSRFLEDIPARLVKAKLLDEVETKIMEEDDEIIDYWV